MCLLLCVWYRPPCPGELNSIKTFATEWIKHRDNCIGTVLVGDLNLHHTHWLRFSTSVSVEGTAMYRFCRDNSFKQLIKQPTQGTNLLDLVITDIDDFNFTKVLPRIADHHVVRTSLCIGVPKDEPHTRTVWKYQIANWSGLKAILSSMDWRFINESLVDDACRLLTANILRHMSTHIPQATVCERPSVHPWFNDECLRLVQSKRDAEGTTNFGHAAAVCSAGILRVYNSYIAHVRCKLRKCRRGSKQWWRLSNEIANRKSSNKGIPALKHGEEWILSSNGKAELLALTFRSKHGLAAFKQNEHSAIGLPRHAAQHICIRSRQTRRHLVKLDVDSGTGPDGIPARVLRLCAEALSVPIAMLCRRILAEGRWPEQWIFHNITAIHKRRSIYDPEMYRGVHLTSQMSKVVERAVGSPLTEYLQQSIVLSQEMQLPRFSFGVYHFVCLGHLH